MDDQEFLKACQLRDEGKLSEAVDEFLRIAKNTLDKVDRAGVLLNAATTLRALGEDHRAKRQLSVVKDLASELKSSHSEAMRDDRLSHLEVDLDFEDSDICLVEGRKEEALKRFDSMLNKYAGRLREPDSRDMFEMIQTRRAFLLVDLGSWKEALPILEQAESFEERKAEIKFYLGHSYVSAHEYTKAQGKLLQALKLGLPKHLEYRAHCELGMVYSRLGDYEAAKSHFEECTEIADTAYVKQAQIWKRLEVTCRKLGLKDEAERYARLASPS